MKAVHILLSAVLAGLACAANSGASVYIFDHKSPLSTFEKAPSSVSPLNARLLFAQRLGLSEYHKLENAEETVLSLLNRFGSAQLPLFSGIDEPETTHRLLVMVDGVEDHDHFFENGQKPAFTISSPPLPSSNRQLVRDFLIQDRHRRGAKGKGCPDRVSHPTVISGGISGNNPSGTCLIENPSKEAKPSVDALQELKILQEWTGFRSLATSRTSIFHISLLDILVEDEFSNRYHQAVAELKRLLTEITRPTNTQESTIILASRALKHSKRAANEYGSYVVPVSNLERREQQEEEPLSFSSPPATSLPAFHDSTPIHPQVFKASIRPKVTMPICHFTNNSCMSTTNSCSGHGICYKKHPDPSDESARDCWACGCSPNVRKDKNGIKTTYWGGPACQKKDVSAPFFLLAGFTVAMVVALSWGVGLLYSIGDEDLPSVIGAGVAGPRAQK